MKLPNKLIKYLYSRLLPSYNNDPDLVIGDDYLHRWHLLPRNKWFNIYYHIMYHDDDDRAHHDHPWMNLSIILLGSYKEIFPQKSKIRETGQVVCRRPKTLHRLEKTSELPVHTLFITGPVVREWGFACPKGWRHWKEYVDPHDKGQIGRGCD